MKINWKNKIYKGKNQDFLTYKSSITNKICQKANLKIQRNKNFPNIIFNDECAYCILPENMTTFSDSLDLNGDGEISDEEIAKAKELLKNVVDDLKAVTKAKNIVFSNNGREISLVLGHYDSPLDSENPLPDRGFILKRQ